MVLFGSGEKALELAGVGVEKVVVRSDTLFLHDPNCVEMNPETDAKMVGYVVRAVGADDKWRYVVPRPSLQELLESPQKFEALKKDSAEWRGARPTPPQ